ncbi:MDN1 [Enterospora canceri]|uniref:Midasin n=1 Tax=Enterospora canceri TaxID=1081671 RepID=A0A1Y1S5X5_9MICR|nr:MDN1 [Enterospora canceri]
MIQCVGEEELLKQIEMSEAIRYPVVLFGNKGKSHLLRKCVKDIHFVDTREIADVKMLGGFWAFDDHEIVFVEGVLVEAMKTGKKLCLKRIDESIAVQQYLMPVVSERSIMCNNGTRITAHDDFRLFFTANSPFKYRNVNFIGPIMHKMSEFKNLMNLCILGNKSERCLRDSGTKCNLTCLKPVDCSCIEEGSDVVLCNEHFLKYVRFYKLVKNLTKSKADRAVYYQAIVNTFLLHDSLEIKNELYVEDEIREYRINLALTQSIKAAFDAIEFNVKTKTPTLLIGETGTGKTALIQEICAENNRKLSVINMSSDFDGFELVGGFKTFDFDKKFQEITKTFKQKYPTTIISGSICSQIKHMLETIKEESDIKNEIRKLDKIRKNKICFEFKKGKLAQAMKSGDWILLDEINLAPEETLKLIESIASKRFLLLQESGEIIEMHDDFRIFACMNPFGDYGKKQFQTSAFNTVIFEDFSNNLEDIKMVFDHHCNTEVSKSISNEICEYFYAVKQNITKKVYSNMLEPVVTGRTFCRIIKSLNQGIITTESVFRCFNLLVFTQLNLSSRAMAVELFSEMFGPVEIKTERIQLSSTEYVLTPQTEIILSDLIAAVDLNLPVLLQGNTSTGKTSMVYALAKERNQKVTRINNHEGTDVGDYLGMYRTVNGLFQFVHGPLIKAMKEGNWIILDELNLAESDVLESLNRLLDDNREIYIPETEEIVKPHISFRLFATQNIAYEGRKGLARSFRNRFVELMFNEKDENEIRIIIQRLFVLPKSFIDLVVETFKQLITCDDLTLQTKVTLRDVLKWCNRKPTTHEELLLHGLELFTERIRSKRNTVFDVFNKVFGKKIKADNLEDFYNEKCIQQVTGISNDLVITKSFRKLIHLVSNAWNNNESVLLVGETGIGKTLICDYVARQCNRKLKTINLSENTDVSDFLGHFEFKDGDIKWNNGTLVTALENGDCFLIDEINLADGSVLERLNSLLETDRSLFIPEINRRYTFQNARIAATMNPSGDFGKKELSPAFRNRFTEIYFTLEPEEKIEIFREKCRDIQPFIVANEIENELMEIIKVVSVRKGSMVVEYLKCVNNTDNTVVMNANKLRQGLLLNEIYDLINIRQSENVAEYSLKMLKKSEDKHFLYFNATNRVFRTFLFDMGVLLVGLPGTGKTSLIENLGKMCGKKVLRINLSENTEIDDLLGTMVCKGNSICFCKSTLVKYLQSGEWIILDEINLCSQSVLEGMNSILDYRKSITLTNGEEIKVHENSKIFATMNPSEVKGRKELPKSSLDRFIIVKLEEYKDNEINEILKAQFGYEFTHNKKLSLRENIKTNKMRQNKLYGAVVSRINSGFYADDRVFMLNDLCIEYKELDREFCIVHSQINALYELLQCILNKIPVILKGEFGRRNMIRFIGKLFGLGITNIYCSKETDITDLLGGYAKNNNTEETAELFTWKDSLLVDAIQNENVVVFHNAESVEKAVFDRLNCLFEFKSTLNVYERSIETEIAVNRKCVFVLFADDEMAFSEAIRDRCHVINLCDTYDYVDLLKINVQGTSLIGFADVQKYQNGMEWDRIDLEKWKRYQICTDIIPNLIKESDIQNYVCIRKNDIDQNQNTKYIDVYEQLIQFKDTKAYEIIRLFEDEQNMLNFNLSEFNSVELKKLMIRNLKNKKLKEMKEFKEKVATVIGTKCFILSDSVTDEIRETIRLLKACISEQVDPALVFYKNMKNKAAMEENNIIDQINSELVKCYKYNSGDMTKLQALKRERENINAKYSKVLSGINPNRDFMEFITAISSNNFPSEFFGGRMQRIRDNFDDCVVLMALESIQNIRTDSQPSVPEFNYNEAVLQLVKNKQIRKCSRQEYNKYSYNLLTNQSNETSTVLYGAICNNNITVDINIIPLIFVWFDDADYDRTLLNMIKHDDNTIRVIETRSDTITINYEELKRVDGFETIGELSCFTTPSEIVEYCSENSLFNDKTEKQLIDILINRKNVAAMLKIEPNYNWFGYLKYHKVTQEYFYNSTVYEFVERLFFVKEYYGMLINKKGTEWLEQYNKKHELYNWIALMDAFDLTRMKENKESELLIKLKRATIRTFKRFNEIVESYRGGFMLQPVTTVMDVKMIKQEMSECCENNKSKTESEFRKAVERSIKNTKLCDCKAVDLIIKDNLYESFINKLQLPEEPETNLAEYFMKRDNSQHNLKYLTAVAKLIHIYNQNIEHIKNADKSNRMIKYALCNEIKLDYLYLIYKIIKESVSYTEDQEEGEGIKNCSDEIEQNKEENDLNEDEINDEYDKNERVEEESNADELDNKGKADYEVESEHETEKEDLIEGSGESNETKEENNQCERMIEDPSGITDTDIDNNDTDIDDEISGISEEADESHTTEQSVTRSIEQEQQSNLPAEYAYKDYTKINMDQTCNNETDEFDDLRIAAEIGTKNDLLEAVENGTEIGKREDEGSDDKATNIKSATKRLKITAENKHCIKLINLIRTVLETNKNSKYRGNFKTGKKLSMKAVVNYIASGFSKDRIWMRRARNQFNYNFNIFIDNSKSMDSHSLVDLLGATLNKISTSFRCLGIDLSLFRFGTDLQRLHSLGDLTFSDESTNVQFIDDPQFACDLNIVLTDGIFNCSHRANFVALILDKNSIRRMARISLVNGRILRESFLGTFGLFHTVVEKEEEFEEKFVGVLRHLVDSMRFN